MLYHGSLVNPSVSSEMKNDNVLQLSAVQQIPGIYPDVVILFVFSRGIVLEDINCSVIFLFLHV